MSLTTQRDIALNTAGDIDMSGPDLKQLSGIAALLQSASIRLKFFQGEWFADSTIGVPYFQQVLIKNPNVSALTSIFRKIILETPGMASLQSLSLNYNPQARTLAVTFSGIGDFGQFDAQTIELTP